MWYVLYYRFYRFGMTLSHTSLHEQTILELDTKQKKILSQPLPVSKADSGNKKLSRALNIEIANILPF